MTQLERKTDKGYPKVIGHQFHVFKERCKGCGYCIEFCPQKTVNKANEINSHGYHVVCMDDSDKCTGCNICAMICPEFAIVVTPLKEEAKKRR